jgi:hypothetical protein
MLSAVIGAIPVLYQRLEPLETIIKGFFYIYLSKYWWHWLEDEKSYAYDHAFLPLLLK